MKSMKKGAGTRLLCHLHALHALHGLDNPEWAKRRSGVLCRAMLVLFLAGVISFDGSLRGAETEKPEVFKMFASPDGRFAVRLREGRAAGNSTYDRAELLNESDGKVLYQFKGLNGEPSEGFEGDGGGFGWFNEPPVFWSPDSRYVAVMCHDHRTGDIDVIHMARGSVRECVLPSVIVPRLEKELDAGRQWQTWLRPQKWTPKDALVANYSGVIRNYEKLPRREGSEGQLVYEYSVKIMFDSSGVGRVVSIKRVQFRTQYVP